MKRILLLATGGTISCDDRQRPLSPVFSAADLLHMIETISSESEIIPIDLSYKIDSTEITFDQWTLLGQELATRLYQFNGIVITHGTDTLAYTSSLLSYWFSSTPIPIVITGSQYPINAANTDGISNLRLAIRAASTCEKGIWVAFDHSIFHGNRVSKKDTNNTSAFWCPNGPGSPRSIELPSGTTPLASNVLFIRLAPGLTPSILPHSLNGLILEVYGAGGLPSQWAKTLSNVDYPVVLVTQCPCGGLSLRRYLVGAAASSAGVLDAGDMTPEAAYTKLIWLLGKGESVIRLKQLYETNLCGERTI